MSSEYSEPVEAILSHVGNELAFTDDLHYAAESFAGGTAKDLIATAQCTLHADNNTTVMSQHCRLNNKL